MAGLLLLKIQWGLTICSNLLGGGGGGDKKKKKEEKKRKNKGG